VAGAAVVASATLAACGSGDQNVTAPNGGTTTPTPLPPGVTVTGNLIAVDLTIMNDLQDTRGFLLLLNRTTKPALIVRAGTTASPTYRGYNASCPHSGTRDLWDPSGSNSIICGAHNSIFDRATGAVVGGPAPRGLTTLPATKSGTTLTVDAS
jgi:Rieske Fe-S protein